MMQTPNAFELLADNQRVAASKRRDKMLERSLAKLVVKSDAEAPMVASPSDKAAFERSKLLTNYRTFLADRRLALLNGKYGSEVRELLTVLDSLALISASGLLSFLAKCNWFLHADRSTRLDILSLISTAIARHRVQNGLPPFDDSIPYLDEPPTAFEVARTNMQVLS